MKKSKIVAAISVIFLATSLLPISFQANAQQQEYMLKIGWISEVDSLSPLLGWTEPAWAYYGLVYDYLFSPDEDLNRRPNLARSCEPLDENMTLWRYHLAKDAKWHDGVQFTADDVIFTINYYRTAQIYFYDPWVRLKGVDIILNAIKVDDYTVDIQFGFPCAIAKTLDFPILPEHWWNTSNNDNEDGAPITPLKAQSSYPNEHPIGTGGFMAAQYPGQPWDEWSIYDEWLDGERITLYRNPDYHNGAPQIDGLQFVFYRDMTVMVEALKRGDIDVAWVSPDAYVALQDEPGITTMAGLFSTSYWVMVGINLNDGADLNPTRFDWYVRKALAHATDKTYILNKFYQGLGIEASTLLSPNTPFWHYEPTSEETFEYNLTLANEILDQHGYYWTGTPGDSVRAAGPGNPHAPEGTRLEYTMVIRVEYPEEYDTALYLQEIWRSIGVELTVIPVDEYTLEGKVYGSDQELFIWYWADPPDPNYLLSIVTSYQLNWDSDTWWVDEEYDELYVQQLQAINKTERQQIVHEAQKINYGVYEGRGISYLILVYPYLTLAWRTDKFKGWATEWHPGKDTSHCWSYPPFYHDLRPITAPDLAGLPVVSVHVDKEYTFTADASDPDSETLTFYWDFGDGTTAIDSKAGTPGTTLTSMAAHSYEAEGSYTYTVKVTDAQDTYDLKSETVHVGPFNLGPRDHAFRADATEVLVGEPISFTVNASDPDGDTLTFAWDFGDGTTETDTREVDPDQVVSVAREHSYDSAGAYIPTVRIIDAGGTESWHNVTLSLPTPITISEEPAPPLYVDPLLIGGAVVAIVAIVGTTILLWRKRLKST